MKSLLPSLPIIFFPPRFKNFQNFDFIGFFLSLKTIILSNLNFSWDLLRFFPLLFFINFFFLLLRVVLATNEADPFNFLLSNRFDSISMLPVTKVDRTDWHLSHLLEIKREKNYVRMSRDSGWKTFFSAPLFCSKCLRGIARWIKHLLVTQATRVQTRTRPNIFSAPIFLGTHPVCTLSPYGLE